MCSAVIIPAVAIVNWSIWVRRGTWRIRWERPNTICVLFQGIALLLVAPFQTQHLGRWLYGRTGIPHLDDFIGHCLYIGAATAIVYSAACRLAGDDAGLGKFTFWTAVPGVVAAHVMLLALMKSHAAINSPHNDFFRVPCDTALSVYWLTYTGIMVYIMAVAAWLLWILRSDPRSRTAAELFIAACSCGGVAAGACIADVVLRSDDYNWLIWWGASGAAALCALGSGRSWRAKLREHEPLLR